MGVINATVDEICRAADFITVHTPLTKETRHIISSREFAKMKDGVRLINCARGGIIDEKALYEAITTGKVAGAALDVYEVEPPVDNPLVGHPKVVTAPHLGASTIEAQENVAVDVSEEILKVLRGEPFKNAVNLPSIPAHVMEKVQPYFTLGEKLGHFLAQVTVGSISEIEIKYSGELTDVDTSPLTRTVLKGVLSFRLGEEVNFVNAPLLAKVRDITVTEQKAAQNKGFTNLLTVALKTTQETRTVAGTRLNGYGARIVKIDDYAIDVAPEGYLLYIHHNDRPGVIGRVGSILGENNVNIATMQVGRRDVGGDAIMMLSVDKPLTGELLDTMGELAEVKSVTQIEL